MPCQKCANGYPYPNIGVGVRMLNSLKSDILGRDTVWFNCSSGGPVKGQALWPASDQTPIDRHKISAEIPQPRLARATAFPRGQLSTNASPTNQPPANPNVSPSNAYSGN